METLVELRTLDAVATTCPDCGAVPAPLTTWPTFVYGVGAVSYQHCTACGARWRYLWSEPEPTSGRRIPVILLAAVLAVLLVAGGLAVFVLRDGGSGFPAHWDAQVAPIAARVETLRGLTFVHPVKVNYLSDRDFEKRLVTSPADLKKEQRKIEQANALLRAAGLLGAGVDLAKAVDTTQAADTAAYYDFDSKQIYVRGRGPLTIETRVTLAHELTHVLQDQHFDLNKLAARADASRSGSADALRALIEGDATRIQDEYLDEQPTTDRITYERLSSQSGDHADQRTAAVPEVIQTEFGAPYIFGPSVIDVVDAVGGTAGVDTALSGPTPSTRIYFDPTVAAAPPLPATPRLAADEHRVTDTEANDDNLDPFTLYLILAARVDQPSALLATDASSAASEVLYTRHGTTCFKAAVATADPASTRYVATVITAWTHTMPDAAVESTTGPVVFHACDPGRRASAPDSRRIDSAVTLAVARLQVTAGFIKLHMPNGLATCVARVLVQQADVRTALLDGTSFDHATPQLLTESRRAGRDCALNPLAGLPGEH